MMMAPFTQDGGEHALPWAIMFRPFRPNYQSYKTSALWQGEVY